MRTICFYSDYGYRDDFAGTCRAVIKRLTPEVEVIDVTHGIAPHDVLGGAFILRNTLPYMPDQAVHLAVVDPGVGGTRRAVALRSGGDRLFVGPDNGLLVPAAEADGGIAEGRELTAADLWLRPPSATFHGRDIFSPVAARLAAGLPLERAGREIDPSTLVRLDLREPRRGAWQPAGGGGAHRPVRERGTEPGRRASLPKPIWGSRSRSCAAESSISPRWPPRSPPCAAATSSCWWTATTRWPCASTKGRRWTCFRCTRATR